MLTFELEKLDPPVVRVSPVNAATHLIFPWLSLREIPNTSDRD
jgi:hypothetical protein